MRTWTTAAVTLLLLSPAVARADVTRAECAAAYEKAQVLRRESKLKDAREQLVVCAQDACPAATKNDCVPWLAETEKLLPSVSVAVQDSAGKDVTGATITIDGAPLAGASQGLAVNVDPGSHVFRAETSDGRRVEDTVVVRAGEKARVVTLKVPGSAGVAGGGKEQPLTPPPGEPEQGRPIALPLVLTVVGVAGVGGAFFFGLNAKSDRDHLADTCAPRCPQGDIDDVKTKLLLSDISLGVGVVALAAATYFWLKSPSSAAASISPVIGPKSGVSVRF